MERPDYPGLSDLSSAALHFRNRTPRRPLWYEHNVYNNIVTGFQVWPVSLFYIIAMIMLCYHLYHGLWSMFHSLGLAIRFTRHGCSASRKLLLS